MAQVRGQQVAPQQRQQYQPQQYQPYAPQPQYQPPPQYEQPQQRPPVTIANLWDAMQVWNKGGQAHKIDREPCPQCGSNQFYSRTSGARRGPPPAPHCYNCGYNGMFEQGDPTTWGV